MMKAMHFSIIAVCVLIFSASLARGAAPVYTASSQPVTQFGLAEALAAVVSSDGNKILAVEGKTAAILDAASGVSQRVIFRASTDYNFGFYGGAFSPDGSKVLLGCTGSNLPTDFTNDVAVLYNAKTGQPIRTFDGAALRGKRVGHTGSVIAVAFSADGTKVLTGSQDNTAKLWNASTGALLKTFTGHTGGVVAVAMSPDGTQVLTGSYDHTARLWDVSTGKPLHIYNEHTDMLSSAVFSPDGSYVLTGSYDHTARLWSIQQDKSIWTFSGHTDGVGAVMFSPNGAVALTLGMDKTIRSVTVNNGQQINSFAFDYYGDGGSLCFFPNSSNLLVCGGMSSSMISMDANTGKVLKSYTTLPSSCNAAIFSPDATQILVATYAGAYLWDKKTGVQLRQFIGHSGWVYALAFSADGKQIVTGSNDKTAKLWSTQSSTALATFGDAFVGHTGSIEAVAISGDGKTVVTGSADKTAKIWDAASGNLQHTLTGHTGGIMSVAFSPNGLQVFTGGADSTVRVWNAKTGAWIRTFTTPKAAVIYALAISADGQRLLAGDSNQELTEWNISSGNQLFNQTYGPGQSGSVAISHDWTRVMFIDGLTTQIYDRHTGENLGTIICPRHYVTTALAFSNSGTQILTPGEGVPLLWNIALNAAWDWRRYE